MGSPAYASSLLVEIEILLAVALMLALAIQLVVAIVQAVRGKWLWLISTLGGAAVGAALLAAGIFLDAPTLLYAT